MISFTVQGRPVAKQAMRIGKTRNGKVICFRSTKVDKAHDAFALQAAPHKPAKPHGGPVRVSLTFHFAMPVSWPAWRRKLLLGQPHTQKPDVDNLQKLALDALKGVFFVDDAQVYDIHSRKAWGEQDETSVLLLFEDQPARPQEERP